MEGTFNSIEQFEQVLYETIKKTGEISLVKFMSQISSEDKDKIKDLYGVEKIGSKIAGILESNPERYIFTEKPNENKNSWKFKVVGSDNVKSPTPNVKSSGDNTTKKVKAPMSRNEKEGKIEHQKDVVTKNKEQSVGEKESTKVLDKKAPKKTVKLAEEDDGLLDDSEKETSQTGEEGEGTSLVDEKLKKLVTKDMVLINDSFYISKYLVTQELYETVMGENPSTFKDDPEPKEKQERRPVETVSYKEAVEFCEKLSKKCGFVSCYNKGTYLPDTNGFRLPTEREWNFVATAENQNTYLYAGSDVPDGFAWYKHNSKTKTHEVGKKNPVMINDSDGVYDMCGNVWEWVMPDSSTEKALYIGGSYEDSEDYLELGKPINKEFTDKETKNSTIGFRICVNFLK